MYSHFKPKFTNIQQHGSAYVVSTGHSIPQLLLSHKYCCYCLIFYYLQILHLFNSVKGITDPTFVTGFTGVSHVIVYSSS